MSLFNAHRHAFGLTSSLCQAAGLSLALLSLNAAAQPSGNPSGTVRPEVRGQAPITPATRAPDSVGLPADAQRAPARSTDSQTNPDNPAARSGNARTPGSGTAGGLTGRHPTGDQLKRMPTGPGAEGSPKKAP